MNYEPELILTYVKMVLIMGAIIGVLWGISWFSKNKLKVQGGKLSGRKINIIENCHIGVKKTISLVQIQETILVIGITDNHMTLLHEIRENDAKAI